MNVYLDPITSYPHPVELPNSYEMPFRPYAGQLLFYVEIGRTENPLQSLKIIEELGYKPQLRLCTFPAGHTVLCALLLYEQHDPYQQTNNDHLMADFEALWHKFPTDENGLSVVHCPRGGVKKLPIAA
jgi:hypothetical protein